MAKKRANGEGSIRKRKDGRWEGRYTAGHTPEGKAIYRNVLGKTQAEVVEKVENGRVYTIEGNSGDSVRQNSYPIGYYEIYGYGTPAY